MADPYTYQSNAAPISSLPPAVLANPPIPPHLRGRTGAGFIPPPGAPNATPIATAQPTPGLFGFLQSLFGGGGPAPAQGMTAMLQRGQAGAGTDQLGNPIGRF